MPNQKEESQPSQGTERTYMRSLGLGGVLGGGNPAAVDVENGKIVRIRPLHYDWKYEKEQFNAWKFSRNGVTLEPNWKTLLAPFSLAYKKRAYSPNRILYPLKRVDWDPEGDRHTENRGKSKFKRISWDEASRLVAGEIRRVHKAYGPYGLLYQGDGHGECKSINPPHGCASLLLDRLGGFTLQQRNPDSWEGWYWGSKHVWGEGSVGMMAPGDNTVKDMTDHCDMVLFWGCDPETTPWGFVGQFPSRLSFFWTEAGIKQIYICPDLNYGAAIHADKWIPILPNTDAAMQLAIIYTWIKEGTYDKQYIETHSIGFDKVKAYVMGEDKDGIAKTPAWASAKCGVPSRTIKALARDWAKKIVSIAHYFGGSYIRGAYSHEPARLECILLGMQGLGKPGVHQCQITYRGMPRSAGIKERSCFNPILSDRIRKPANVTATNGSRQIIPKTLLHKVIPNPPVTFYGSGAIMTTVEDQFKKYQYPIPKEEGGTEIHMIWTDSPCRTTCWNGGFETVEAMKNSKVECIVVQHPWMENDCVLADIILPVSTTFEVEDIVTNTREGVQFQSVQLQKQAIPAIGESKSDFEVVCEIAKQFDLLEEVTEGETTEDLEKSVFNVMGLGDFTTWEQFKEKEYFVFPIDKDWESDPAGLIKFYKDPVANPLSTPSGKLEFYSERLAKYFPDDQERPPIPHWVENSETHSERLSSERSKEYPLLMMSNHGRWRVHAQCDDISWTREVMTCKVKGWDGYLYEPLWIHPSDASKRNIKNGDIVKTYNQRGIVLCGAIVWERIMPGVVYVDHGSRCDFIIPEKLDRGGAIDLISPDGIISKNCVGEATSGFLVEVQQLTESEMQSWQEKYPEPFQRKYDPASGLDFNGWVIE